MDIVLSIFSNSFLGIVFINMCPKIIAANPIIKTNTTNNIPGIPITLGAFIKNIMGIATVINIPNMVLNHIWRYIRIILSNFTFYLVNIVIIVLIHRAW